MDNFKEASKLKLRFETSKGSLSAEQLWDLSQTSLATIVKNLKTLLKKESDDELSFLDDTVNQVDKVTQLRFDIIKDIYLTKKAEREAIKNEAETKFHNQKILELIKKRQDSKLEEMSEEDLLKMLK